MGRKGSQTRAVGLVEQPGQLLVIPEPRARCTPADTGTLAAVPQLSSGNAASWASTDRSEQERASAGMWCGEAWGLGASALTHHQAPF